VADQSFESHAHHPIPTYVATLFTLVGLVAAIGSWWFGWNSLHLAVVALAIAAATLVAISRTYITRLQDRIILLEMRLRTQQLLPPAQAARLQELGIKHVVALRFASDEELGELLDRAVREQLVPKDIKRAVKRWRADHLRT
jgi:hypothetical protein